MARLAGELLLMGKKNKRVTEQDREHAERKIDERVAEVHRLLVEAQKIADDNGVTFSLQVAYGMGGTYFPPSHRDDEDFREGWVSSSSMC
jgi:hypothetical protein